MAGLAELFSGVTFGNYSSTFSFVADSGRAGFASGLVLAGEEADSSYFVAGLLSSLELC